MPLMKVLFLANLNFPMVVSMKTLFRWEFIAFLVSDEGQNGMANNSLSIHVESGNIFTRISIWMKIFAASL